jgi:CubicO group peptidase (beta-lactamase class C family)
MQGHLRTLAATIVVGMMWTTIIVGQSSRGDVRTAPSPRDLDRYISELHKAFYPEPVAPGLVVVVVKDSRVILLKGFGYADLEAKRPVDPQTVFYIASSAKPFFGLTAALLDHKGLIDLDAPLSTYLPGVKLQPPLSPDKARRHNFANCWERTLRQRRAASSHTVMSATRSRASLWSPL